MGECEAVYSKNVLKAHLNTPKPHLLMIAVMFNHDSPPGMLSMSSLGKTAAEEFILLLSVQCNKILFQLSLRWKPQLFIYILTRKLHTQTCLTANILVHFGLSKTFWYHFYIKDPKGRTGLTKQKRWTCTGSSHRMTQRIGDIALWLIPK